MLSSSSALEMLLFSPGSPRFSLAGRLSSITASPPVFFPSPNSLVQPEADIGLQSPGSISEMSDAKITYADILASSHTFDWPTTPRLGAGPQLPDQLHSEGGKSSHESSAAKRCLTARRDSSDGRCASFSQVLFPFLSAEVCACSALLKLIVLTSYQPRASEGVHISPVDLFHPTVGLGLGLTLPLSLVEVSDESLPLSPSPIAEPTRHVSSGSSKSVETTAPTAVVASTSSAVEPPVITSSSGRYAGLGHGLPPHLRAPQAARPRLPSIPEDAAITNTSVPVNKLAQHAGLGLGRPSVLRKAAYEAASSSSSSAPVPAPTADTESKAAITATPLKTRIQSTVHELFSTRKFPKRALFAIPEARSREASTEAGEKKGAKGKGREMNDKSERKAGQQQHGAQSQRSAHSNGEGSASIGPRLQMSPMMRLAAQSVLEEERKLRKKAEKRARAQHEEVRPVVMSPMMRFASLAVQELEEEKAAARELKEKEKTQRRQAGKEKRFLFLF
ncbi:hypothetical protein B0H11DRAFT_2074780 [Mycena galericulata]|nr:hypothetical protein B0H11DRAFT_2074780 [Mycena galericulata]